MTTANGVRNPVTVSIPPGGQIARQFGEIFGGTGSFNGWVQAASSSSGLTGFFLNGNTALTDLDGAGSVASSPEAVLPIAAEDAVAKTEVTIVNVNTDPINATLTLFGPAGASLQSKDITLPGRGLIRQTLLGLFGQGDYATASHIRIRADRPLIAHEVVADYLIKGSNVRRETIALAGQKPSNAQTYVLPQFVTGGGWLSLIGLANAGGVGQDITLTAYREDGTLWPAPSNPKRISLDANGGLRATADELFGFSNDTLITGWIEVKSSLGFLSAYIGYGNNLTPSFALVSATDTLSAARYVVFSQVAEGVGYFTGLTVVNPGKVNADIEFYTMRPDGTTVGKSTFSVPPNSRVGKLFRELLPASLDQVGGWGFLRSSQPVIGAVLFGSTNGFALANVPQQLPAGDFIPPALQTGSISGSARSQGSAVADVQVTLTGPVTATRMTDGLGRYVFAQLPKGDYKVTATKPGAQLSPAERPVSVDRQNINQVDFEAGGIAPAGLPIASFVTPASTFAGNRTFSIRILGNGFTPASVVRFNDLPLPTTFISSTELQAVLPQAQLAAARTISVVVETPPPGGGRSDRLDFTVNPAPTNPLVEGQAATGQFPSGVAIDTKRNRVLVTNQSDDSVSVIDLKTLTKVTDVKVGRSPADGIAIYAAADIALVANPGTNDVSVIDLATNRESTKIKVGTFPLGVAVDESIKRAFVVNRDSNNVSVINLDTLAVAGTFNVGALPYNVAVNPKTHIGVVSNSSSNSVTVFDTTTNGTLGTLNVGTRPRGVAINSDTNQLLVVNSNSNDVWIIDLTTRSLITRTGVGPGPTNVAIHQPTNTAIVTTSSVTAQQRSFGVLGSISVINLATQEVSTIAVGAAAYGVDIDTENQRAVIADFGSNDITVVRVPNPRPRIDDISPKTFPVGGGNFPLIIRGSGFLPTSVVTINGNPLPTTYISAGEVRAILTSTLLDTLLTRGIERDAVKGGFKAVTPLQFNIGVSNPGPGGGDSPPPSGGSNNNQLQPQNSAPVLLSVSPGSIQTGEDLTLTLSGNNFNATSIVNFGAAQYSPSSVSSTSMNVFVPRSELTAGNTPVSVTNPPPGGGTTASFPFQIIAPAQANPAPSVSAVSPSSIPAGTPATTVTVEGSGFIARTSASLNGVSGSIGGNSITFNVPASALLNPGTLSGIISNPTPGGGSATFSVNVLNVTPTISGFTPASAAAGANEVRLAVTGSNFREGSQVTVEGTPIPTTFGSASQIAGTMPEGFLRRAGQVRIGVTNPPPGGGSAEGGTFTITSPRPSLTALNPARLPIQTVAATITLTGSGFAGNSRVTIGGATVASVFDSSTSLSVTVPASLLTRAAVLDVQVTNPAPGGGSSEVLKLGIDNSVPIIESVSPNRIRSDQTNVVLTVTGRNFVTGSRISVGARNLDTTFVSATTLTAPLPPPLPLGRANVVVTNPEPGGGASNAVEIEISALPPVISGVSPGSVGAGQQIRVTGANFGPGSTVFFRGAAIPTTAVSATELVATIPVTAATGSGELFVRNPATTNSPVLDSAIATITIVNPVPAISSLDPGSALPGARITVKGQGFLASSQVSLNDSVVLSSFVDGETMTFVVPIGTRIGSASVTVTNPGPGGGTSGAATLTIISATPSVSSVSPASGLIGSTVAISVNGSNFAEGATILFNGNAVSTTFVSSTLLTATVAIAGSAGTVGVSVSNPGGVTSNSVSFQIAAPPPVVVPAPALTSISPSSGFIGSTVTVTLTGSNFSTTATSVNVSGAGITAGSVSVSNSSTLFASFTIAANADLGGRSVTVSTAAGASNAVTFTVTPRTITVGGVNPISGPIAGGTAVTISGSGFAPGVQVYFNGFAATVTGVTATTINATTPANFTSEATVTVILGESFGTCSFRYVSPARSDVANGVITNVAGIGPFAGESAPALTAQLHNPSALIRDAQGNLYISDTGNGRIRKVRADGTIQTIAGTIPAEDFSGDNGPAILAVLHDSRGLAFDAAGNLFVADSENNRIRRIDTHGAITTVAGNGEDGFSGDGGQATAASLSFPVGLAFDSAGNLYFSDANNNRIRRITPAGVVSTFAGDGNTSSFYSPRDLAFDAAGNLYVSDAFNNKIKKVTPGGAITTLAGNGSSAPGGANDVAATTVPLGTPRGLYFDASANVLLVAVSDDARVRRIDLGTGIITTVAGTGTAGYSGDGGAPAGAQLDQPVAVAQVGADLYILEKAGNRVRKIAGGVISTVVGSSTDAAIRDGGSAQLAKLAFRGISGIATDAAGQVYIPDVQHHRIRRVETDGTIRTFAGTGTTGSAGDNGPATSAQLSFPSAVAVDRQGNVYIADTGNRRIRKVTPAGTITTVAGDGVFGTSGDGGPAASAHLGDIYSLAVDPDGNLYLGDFAFGRIRKVNASTGVMTTIAGGGTRLGPVFSDLGPAVDFSFGGIASVAVDGAGNVYAADFNLNRIYKVEPSGLLTLVAGNGSYGIPGDGSRATAAPLSEPSSLAFGPDGRLYIGQLDGPIVRLNPDGTLGIVTGKDLIEPAALSSFSSIFEGMLPPFVDGLAAQSTELFSAGGLAFSPSGDLVFADVEMQRIRLIKTQVSISGLTSIVPNTISEGVTLSAVINGSGLGGATAVNFSDTDGLTASIVSASDSQLRLTIRAAGYEDVSRGAHTVTVVTPAGNITNAAVTLTVLRYIATPAITSILPASGSTAGGNNVTIAGFNFHPLGQVLFGDRLAVISSITDIQIVVKAPAGLTGATTVTVRNPDGTYAQAGYIYTSPALNSITAGYMTTIGGIGRSAGDGGPATAATFDNIVSVLAHPDGTIFIADSGAQRIRRRLTNGNILTFLTGIIPSGMAVDAGGNLLVGDRATRRVLKVTMGGVVTVVAGSFSGSSSSGDGGPALDATFSNVGDIAVDASGNIYVAEDTGNRVRKISTAGIIAAFAGTGDAGSSGDDGLATAALLNNPSGLAVDASGNVYISDRGNARIRKVAAETNLITTFTLLSTPQGLAFDAAGNLYVADGPYVRRITPGLVSTNYLGTGVTGSFNSSGQIGTAVDVSASNNGVFIADGRNDQIYTVPDGPVLVAGLAPSAVTDGIAANLASLNIGSSLTGGILVIDGNLVFSDAINNRIRKINLSTGVITTIAGTGTNGFGGDGGSATSANLSGPQGLAVDGAGNIYVADTGNQRVRRITPSGTISTVAGGGVASSGAATTVVLSAPRAVQLDAYGNLYIAESSRIRVVDRFGILSDFAGSSTSGFVDNVVAGSARFSAINGMVFDAQGNLYVADSNNRRVRKIDAATAMVSTFAGTGGGGSVLSGIPATSANLGFIRNVYFDAGGNLFISDNNRVWKVDPAGTITIVAGSTFSSSTSPDTVDYGPATGLSLTGVNSLVTDAVGNIFFIDTTGRIRAIRGGAATSSIFGISPSYGLTGATVNAVVRGTLTGVTGVTFSGTGVTGAVTGSGEGFVNVTVTINADAAPGLRTFTVTQNAGPASSGLVTFGVIAGGQVTVSNISPASTPAAGGATVTITGTNFTAGTRVRFGTRPAATISAQTLTSLSVVAPSSTGGVETIYVDHPNGSVATGEILFVPPALSATASGNITTVAGKGRLQGENGAATSAILNFPRGAVKDAAGRIYIADGDNQRIRIIRPDGTIFSHPFQFGLPASLAFGPNGVYIADSSRNVIYLMNSSLEVSVVAGSGAFGFSGDGGLAIEARFSGPQGLAVDSSNNLYIADTSNSRIRKVTASNGTIATIAGNGTAGFAGDGILASDSSVQLNRPYSVAVDSANNVYIADTANALVRAISAADGKIRNFAGQLNAFGNASEGVAPTTTPLSNPLFVAVDGSDNVYISTTNSRVRKVSGGVITTFAGSGNSSAGFGGDGGNATSAFLFNPIGISFTSGGATLIADTNNHRIRQVAPGGQITTIAGGGAAGDGDAGAAATLAISGTPSNGYGILMVPGFVFDAAGNAYFADTNNHRVRKIDALSGTITTIAGIGVSGLAGDGGAATAAQLSFPMGLAFDSQGNLYIGDTYNAAIRRVAPNGTIGTVAGNGTQSGTSAGPATNPIGRPYGIAVDKNDVLYFVDLSAAWKFPIGGNITQIASGFSLATDIKVDTSGNVYIADLNNNKVHKVAAAGGSSVFAGTGTAGSAGDGGQAASAQLSSPVALAIDPAGSVYIAEESGSRVRKVAGNGVISTVAGSSFGFSGDGGVATSAALSGPKGVGVDPNGNIYIADGRNNRVRVVKTGAAAAFATSIAPNSGDAGQTVSATIGGSGLTGATGVIFSGSGVTATIQDGPTDTSLPISISIAGGAATGQRMVTVVGPYTLIRNVAVFTVNAGSGPALSVVIPAQRVVNSGNFVMDLTGTNFTNASTVYFGGVSQTTTFIDDQHLQANIPNASIASLGNVSVRVRTANVDSNALNFTVLQPAIVMSPNPLTVSIGGTALAGVSVNQAVSTAGGIDIVVTSSNTGLATVSSPAHINQGETTTTVTVTGVGAGTATLSANLTGYTGANISANVTNTPQPVVNVTPAATTLSAAGTAQVTVSRINSNNGAGLNVNLAVNRAGYFSFPATVTIPAGQDSVQATLSGIQADPTPPVVLSASAAGHTSGSTSQITVRLLRIQMTPAILVNPQSSTNLQIVLSDPAPAGGVTITLTSANPGVATVVNQTTIAAGATQTSAQVTGISAGNTTITASAPGFPNTQAAVQVQNVLLTTVPGNASFLAGSTYARSVTLVMNVNAVEGGQLVNLASSNTEIATVAASVTIPSGASAVNFVVTGLGPGTATITASSPGLTSGTFTASIIAPTFQIDDSESQTSTKTGIRRTHYARISAAAPIGGIPITITSSDPSKLKVAPCKTGDTISSSCNDTDNPVNSLTLTAPSTYNYVYFDVAGRDTAGDEPRLNSPIGVARDGAGHTYIAEYSGQVIRKIDGTTGLISRFGGNGTNTHTGDSGQAADATISGPTGLAVFNNVLYIAEYNGNTIRKIDLASNIITTVVASAQIPGANPYDIAFNAAGDMFFAGNSSGRIYKYSAGGVLTTYGGGGAGAATATGVAATSLNMGSVAGIAVDGAGNVYYADYSNSIVNQIDTGGTVRRVAGSGGTTVFADNSDATAAHVRNPRGLAVDRTRNLLYIADAHRVLKVTLNAVQPPPAVQPLTRVAGDGTANAGCCGDGLSGRFSSLNLPDKISVDANGNLLIGDRNNNRVRELSLATGLIDTVMGSGQAGSTGDGLPARGVYLTVSAPGFVTKKIPVDIDQSSWEIYSLTTSQTLGTPFGFSVRQADNDRMADSTTVTVTALSPFTVTSPLTIGINARSASGTATPTATGSGRIRIEANGTRFTTTTSNTVTVLPVAQQALRIQDSAGYRMDLATGVRRQFYVRLPSAAGAAGVSVNLSVSPAGNVKIGTCNTSPYTSSSCTGGALGDTTSVVVPNGQNYAYFDVAGQAAAFTDTRLNEPYGLNVDANGNIYISDRSNYRVRKLSAAGVLSTFAGTGSSAQSSIAANQQASATTGMVSRGVTSDAAGNVYIADEDSDVIYKVDSAGVITVAAGVLNGAGSANGPLGTGKLNGPMAVAAAADGTLYIADYNNARIRKAVNGTLSTIAGGGSGATPALQASFSALLGIALDPATDDVYFADYNAHKVYRVVQATGALEAVAGTGGTGFNGDQADATQATLYNPYQIAIGGDYLYIADMSNHRIRRVQIRQNPRPIETVAGSTSAGFDGDGDQALVAQLYNPSGVSVNAAGDVFISDRSNQRIRKVTVATGKISTIIGGGTGGFAGDGMNGRGVVIRAEVAAGGPGYLPVEATANVQQSAWDIYSYGTSQTTTTAFTYRVRQSNGDRMAAATTFTPTTTAPLNLAELTIANNETFITGTATPNGSSGSGRITVPAVGTSFTAVDSNVIVVLPSPQSFLRINDSYGARIDAATGVRRQQYVRLPEAATAPVTINLSVVPTGNVKISTCDTSPYTSSNCTGAALGDTATVIVPVGQNYAYFDVAGQSTVFTDTRLNEPYGLTVDASGNLFVADRSNYRIRKLSAAGALSTFAGTGSSTQSAIAANQQASATTGMLSRAVASDAAGNIYIADEDSDVIYKVDTAGVITVAAGVLNAGGNVNGPLGTGKLNGPLAVAAAADGTLYIADYNNARIRKAVNGTLSTIAGGGSGATPALQASFNALFGIALDPATDDVYFSDYNAHKVYRVVQATGALEVVAGTGGTGFNGDQSDAKQATLYNPYQIAIGGDYLYIADMSNHRIRRVQIRQNPRPIETIAGTTSAGFSGDGDSALVTQLYNPSGVAVNAAGDVFISDRSNQRVRKVSAATGKINTIVGSGTGGFGGDTSNGRGVLIRAEVAAGGPNYLATEASVNVQQSAWQIDSYGTSQTTTTAFTYRVIQSSSDRMAADTTFTPTTSGPFTLSQLTIANNGTTVTGTATPNGTNGSGRITIPAIGTTFTSGISSVIVLLPPALASLNIDDGFSPVPTATGVRNRHYVRLPATVSGATVTVNLTSSDASRVKVSACSTTNYQSATCTGDGAAAGVTLNIPSGQNHAYFDLIGLTSSFGDARLNEPYGLNIDANGNLYVADRSNYRIRKWSSAGVLTTFAGTGSSTQTGAIAANQLATATTGMLSRGVTSDAAGNVYIADEDSDVIFKVDTSGVITVVAGILNSGGNVNGPLGTGKLNGPLAVTAAADGTLYIADYNNARIRKAVNGTLSTIAGGGSGATPALLASFSALFGVALDPATDDVYFSDYNAHKVYRVVQATGALEVVAGTGSTGFNGDQADATQATLYNPYQIAIRGDYLYIADMSNHRIRRVQIRQTPRPIETVAGTTTGGFSTDGDSAIVSKLYNPSGVAVDASGNIYISDRSNQRIRKVSAATGKIETIVGSGSGGYGGDNSSGRGVTIRAEVAAGGPNYLPVEVGTRVNASSWTIDQVASTQTGPSFTFRVQQTASEVGGARMNSSTTFSLTSTNDLVFTYPAPRELTIPNNGTAVTGTANTVGAGSAQIVAQASATGIDQGSTAAITIQPVITSVTNNTGNANSTTAAVLNGRNLGTATGVTAPANITATITGGSGTALNVSIQVGAGVDSGAKTLTLLTPGGNVTFTFTVN